MRRLVPLLVCCGCAAEGGDGAGAGNGLATVSGLGLTEVSINQGVKIPLMAGGQPAPVTVPVVAGRPGLLRFAVQPDPDWKPRPVVARLELLTASAPLPALEVEQLVTGPSADADLATTFNFELAADVVATDLAFGVSLREVSGESRGSPSSSAVYPTTGHAPLPAQSSGGALHMVLVPIQYDADGSGRLPELGDAQVALYRERLLQLYPATSIDIRIHEPMPYSQPIAANGDGWGEVLQWLLARRNQERIQNEALPNEYYYGLFMPKAGMGLYCGGGPVCVLGLSAALPDPAEEFVRGSVGLGFPGEQSADTMAHETGHAHGRLHAPCAPFGLIQNTDAGFPYPDGRIGSWGYDLGAKTLLDPQGTARDFMGYCDPAWVSDYTWRALFERMAFVNASSGAAGGGGGGGEPMWMVSLDGEGRAKLGHLVTLAERPRGELRMVDVLDDSGGLRRRDPARFYAYSHLPGGFLLVSRPLPGDRSFTVGRSTIHWAATGKPLPSR